MALQFRPFQIPEQREEPNLGLAALQGAGTVIDTYMKLKLQKQAQDEKQRQAIFDYAKARQEYGTEFDDTFRSMGGQSFLPANLNPNVTPTQTQARMQGESPIATGQYENPYKAYEDPYGPLPGMEGGLSTPAASAAAPVVPAAPAAPKGFRSYMDITPESLAEIRKRKGTKGLKEFQDTQGFMLEQEKGNAQLGQIAIQNENALRDDFSKQSQKFSNASDQMSVIRALYSGEPDKADLGRFTNAKTPDAARDMALIFSFMKILDDGSTVRETEFANAQNATGVSGQIRNLWNRLQSGERLNPQQRAEFVAAAGDLYAGRLQKHKAVEDTYRGIAERQGVNVQNVVVPFGLPDYDPAQFRLKGSPQPSVPPKAPADPAASAGGPPNGKTTVRQRNFTYTWNPATKRYE